MLDHSYEEEKDNLNKIKRGNYLGRPLIEYDSLEEENKERKRIANKELFLLVGEK